MSRWIDRIRSSRTRPPLETDQLDESDAFVELMHDSVGLKKHGLEALRRLYPDDPIVNARLNKTEGCTPRSRCGDPLCDHCGVHQSARRRQDGKPTSGKSEYADVSRNFRKRYRRQAEALFAEFPENNIGCLTLHVGLFRTPEELKTLKGTVRRQLSRFLSSTIPTATVWARFEVVYKQVSEVETTFPPDSDWRTRFDGAEKVWVLHLHGIIHVPGLSPKDIQNAFALNANGKRSIYSGARQVRVDPVRHRTGRNGKDDWGVGGFAEYSGKRHFRPVSNADNTKLLRDWIHIDEVLKDRKGQFRFSPKATDAL